MIHRLVRFNFRRRFPSGSASVLSAVALACVVTILAQSIVWPMPTSAQGAQATAETTGANLVTEILTEMGRAPIPSEPPNAARGRLLYAQNCAPCHGDTGLGDGPAAADLPNPVTALADPQTVYAHTPAEWFLITKHGRLERMMPPWEARMNDGEIWQTILYAWGLHLDRAQLAQAELRYAESCAACHGPNGAGDGLEAASPLPSFSDPGYTLAASQADWLAGWQAAHPEIGPDWPVGERVALLESMRAFSYVAPWRPVALEGEGVISGRVTLATPGASWPAAPEVRLETYLDFELIASTTTEPAADGSFSFEGLALDPDLVYLAVTGYDEVQYSSPVLTLSPDQPFVDTQILLYARTNDPTGLFIDRANWVIEPLPDGFLVGQILSFGLSGERTYTGSQLPGVDAPVTVAVFVPPTAQDVRLENGILGGRYHRQGDLIYDTVPIAPGQTTHQIVMRYVLPLDADHMTVYNEFNYPVNRLNLLIGDLPEIDVSVPGLDNMGLQDFQGTVFQVWQGADLNPGPVSVHFFGLGGLAPNPARTGNLETGVLFGLGGMVTLLLVTALTLSWRQGRFETSTDAADLDRQRVWLAAQIAQLDDLHVAGALAEDQWRQRRAQLKVAALAVAERQRASVSAVSAQEGTQEK